MDQVAEQFDIEEMSMQAKAAEGIEVGNETEGEVADSVPQSPENSDGKDLIVIGDEGKLRGILIYLLSNVSTSPAPLNLLFSVSYFAYSLC